MPGAMQSYSAKSVKVNVSYKKLIISQIQRKNEFKEEY